MDHICLLYLLRIQRDALSASRHAVAVGSRRISVAVPGLRHILCGPKHLLSSQTAHTHTQRSVISMLSTTAAVHRICAVFSSAQYPACREQFISRTCSPGLPRSACTARQSDASPFCQWLSFSMRLIHIVRLRRCGCADVVGAIR